MTGHPLFFDITIGLFGVLVILLFIAVFAVQWRIYKRVDNNPPPNELLVRMHAEQQRAISEQWKTIREFQDQQRETNTALFSTNDAIVSTLSKLESTLGKLTDRLDDMEKFFHGQEMLALRRSKE